jgi:hypothetical protein
MTTTQSTSLSKQMSQMMKFIQGTLSDGQNQNSPARKQPRLNNAGTPMDEDTTVPPFVFSGNRNTSPASPDSPPKQNGSAGRRK